MYMHCYWCSAERHHHAQKENWDAFRAGEGERLRETLREKDFERQRL